QLPPTDEIVMVSGAPPIRAKKARYFEDTRLTKRIVPPPELGVERPAMPDAWSSLPPQKPSAALRAEIEKRQDSANSGLRREPELPDHLAIAKETTVQQPREEFAVTEDEPEDNIRQARVLNRQMRRLARQVSLDPDDGLGL